MTQPSAPPSARASEPHDRSRHSAVRPQPPTPTPQNPLRDLYLTPRPFWIVGALVVLAGVAVFWAPLLWAVRAGAFALAAAGVADVFALWARAGLEGERAVPDKLSLGGENEIWLTVRNGYGWRARVTVLDEVPVQFQKRDAGRDVVLAAGETRALSYTLRPTRRGAYGFGVLNLFADGPLGLVRRRFRTAAAGEAVVYPSIQQMQRYAFLAASNRLEAVGVKRVRRLGHTMEFDQIRPYVAGDDRRAINWQATARAAARGGAGGFGELMVNQYQEERAQPVVAALDMGRAMRSPFDGLTLLDHAVNAALVLLNTALHKHDRAGLVTFDAETRTVVPPARRRGQIGTLLEALYRVDPGYTDPSYHALYATLRERVRQRALVLLFANFDTVAGLERQLPYLRQIARRHRLVVVLFENTGIRDLLGAPSERLEDAYVKAVAEGLASEKREIALALERSGIGALLTRPETLTVDAVNRYLSLKARGAF